MLITLHYKIRINVVLVTITIKKLYMKEWKKNKREND